MHEVPTCTERVGVRRFPEGQDCRFAPLQIEDCKIQIYALGDFVFSLFTFHFSLFTLHHALNLCVKRLA